MRSTVIITQVLLLLCGVMYFSCDNEGSVDPRYEDYFVKYYGEEGNQQGVDIEVLPDGYLLVGNSRGTGDNSEIFIVRTDLLGNRIAYGTIAEGTEDLFAVDAVVNDAGQLYIAAELRRTNGDVDMYVCSVASGSISIGMTPDQVFIHDLTESTYQDVPASLTLVSNGDIIVTGYTTRIDVLKPEGTSGEDYTDIISLRLYPDLTEYSINEWRRIYGRDKADYGHKVIERNGEFLFYASSFYTSDPGTQGGLNLMVFPTNNIGVVSGGYKTFGSMNDELGADMITTSEGGSLLIADSNNRMLLTRLSADNNLVGFPTEIGKSSVTSKSVFEAINGGYLVAGNWSNVNNSDFYLAKVSVGNVVEWEKTFGGLDQDQVSRVTQKPDGTILIVGTIVLDSQEKMCLIKTNSNGDLQP